MEHRPIEKLMWYLKLDGPSFNDASLSGPPLVPPMPLKTFEAVYKHVVETLGGTHDSFFIKFPFCPKPIHIHAMHAIVWNYRGFVKVEKMSGWGSVAIELNLCRRSPAPRPSPSDCLFVTNAFFTSGLAQFQAWYTLSLSSGNFLPLKPSDEEGPQEIPYSLPSESEYDDPVDLLTLWIGPDLETKEKPTLLDHLKSITNNMAPDISNPRKLRIRALSEGLEELHLSPRQAQSMLKLGVDYLANLDYYLTVFGIPDATMDFLETHVEGLKELQQSYKDHLDEIAKEAEKNQPSAV